jgi:tetratricopeptide (TPR) repeat protein
MEIPGSALDMLKLDRSATFTEIQSSYIQITQELVSHYFLNKPSARQLFLKYYKAYRELVIFYHDSGEKMDNSLLPDSHRETLLINKAIYSLIQRHWDDAKNVFTECLKTSGNQSRIHSYLALIEYQKSDYNSCRNHVKRAIQANNHNSLAWVLLAKIYYLEEKYHTCLDMVLTSLRIDPTVKLKKFTELLKNPEFEKIKENHGALQIIKDFLNY